MSDVIQDSICLYILMRTDMASLNPGKAVAQGSHAANQCIFEAKAKVNAALNLMIERWEAETGKGFGTCIVLGVTESQMYESVERAECCGPTWTTESLHASVVHDPTYPLQDGETLHLIPVNTCAYVFGYRTIIRQALAPLGLELMP